MSKWAAVVVLGVIGATAVTHAQEVSDREAWPTKPPVPTYPVDAARAGIQAKCEARFHVSKQGLTYNIQVSCTHPAFCSESERAISRVEFEPKLLNGTPVIRQNVTYPLEYRLTGWDPEKGEHVTRTDPIPGSLEPCEKVAIS